MKFKAEMCLLVMAIGLFVLSAFFYSHHPTSETLSLSVSLGHPYRIYAITFVGFGSVLTLAASFSYSKRSKTVGSNTRRV